MERDGAARIARRWKRRGLAAAFPAAFATTLAAGVACDGGLGLPGARTDRLPSLPDDARTPRVDGDRVVYGLSTEHTDELHALDLSTGESRVIDVEPGWIGGHRGRFGG